jgi:hypothetical protein
VPSSCFPGLLNNYQVTFTFTNWTVPGGCAGVPAGSCTDTVTVSGTPCNWTFSTGGFPCANNVNLTLVAGVHWRILVSSDIWLPAPLAFKAVGTTPVGNYTGVCDTVLPQNHHGILTNVSVM